MDLQIVGLIFHMGIWLQAVVGRFSSLPGLLSAFVVVRAAACAREAHSDGAQSVCSPVASSTEAFQLLQGDLTKISCPLLNYNLPSTSPSLPPSLHFGQKNRPPSLFRCQLMSVFVRVRHVHVRVKLPRLPAAGVCEMIGGARIWSGSAGRSRAKAFTFSSLSFLSSISLFFFLPVVMISCLLHGFMLSPPPSTASISFRVLIRFPPFSHSSPYPLTQVSTSLHHQW